MRTKLGIVVAALSVASTMTFALPAAAAPDDAPTPEETLPPLGPVTVEPEPSSRRGGQIQLTPPPPVPTTTTTTIPISRVPPFSGTGRRIVYSKAYQHLWVVNEHGVTIKHHAVSGRQVWCDPRVGEYRVFSRSRYTFSLDNPSIIWGYMVRFAKGCQGGNIGFHEIPVDSRTGYRLQSVSQLGTPLSGGCVRQAIPDAVWIWNWAGIGTKVVVLP